MNHRKTDIRFVYNLFTSVSCNKTDHLHDASPCFKAVMWGSRISKQFLCGRVRAVCMENPMFDLIIGNVSDVKWNLQKLEGVCSTAVKDGLEGVQGVVTRAQARREADVGEKLLKVFEPVNLNITSDQLRTLQQEDPSLKEFWDSLENGQSKQEKSQFVSRQGILYRRKKLSTGYTDLQLVVPTSLRKQVLSFAHDSAMGGHLGRQKTLDRIAGHFYWKGIVTDVARWCQSCDLCQRTEPKGRTGKVPLGQMPIIDTPFKRVSVDLVGPIFPATERGHKYIL